MKHHTLSQFLPISAIATALSLTCAHAAPPEGPGWIPLFDGTDLSAWKIPVGDNGHWKILDGVIDILEQERDERRRKKDARD